MPNSSNPILTDPVRLSGLQQTSLLDSPPEESFDRLTRLAAKLVRAPLVLVSLVDADRQFFKSCIGLADPALHHTLAPLSHSFCKHVVISSEPLVVCDAREHEVLKSNGAVAYGVIAYAGIPLVTADGLTIGSFCAIDSKPRNWTPDELDTLRDLAALVMTEINLRRAKANAEAANESKDRFLAFLSHELRGPLTPALLTATSMESDPAHSREVRDDAGMIRRNIQLATRLTDDLLDVSRLASGKLELRAENTDLHDLLTSGIALRRAEADAKRIRFIPELAARRHHVHGDPLRLTQVVQNVLGNAVKFTPAMGTIRLRSADLPDGRIKIEIADNGIGIDSRVIGRIFYPYEQGGRSVTREHSGLGLGLAICKGIVEAHGGKISATSDGLGRGTTIHIDLPVAEVAAAPARVLPEPAHHTGLKILLVEDHEDTRRVMSRLLSKLSHAVTPAGCVADALAAAGEGQFDLVISDLGLPDGTGMDLMRELTSRRPIRGIALTGYGTETDVRETLEAGFTTHLTKPINFQDLVDAIDKA